MPSVIRGSDNFDTAGGNAVKAWVNFNGTGTVAIRASGNVSSITDNGVGNYMVNFATAMPDSNYAFACNMDGAGGSTLSANSSARTASSITVIAWFSYTTAYETTGDPNTYCVSIFR